MEVVSQQKHRTQLYFVDSKNVLISDVVLYTYGKQVDILKLTSNKNNYFTIKAIIDRVLSICYNNGVNKITVTLDKEQENVDNIVRALTLVKFKEYSNTKTHIGLRKRIVQSRNA